ncbi:MAG TPA: arylsulfotransferase family protein [Solirubrobacteraceae bacterium]|nr:arylsulfotransferase family protein [Solirubrobacteraceae bacterium]
MPNSPRLRPRVILVAAALAGVAVVSGLASAQTTPYAIPGPVSAYPLPGTLSASPGTQISFRGSPPDRLGRITVRGSRSGTHTGSLRAHSDGQGASWVTKKAFRGGERVTVRTAFDVRGGTDGDFSFRIARLARGVTIPKPPVAILKLLQQTGKPGKRRHFRSRPDLAPPLVTVSPGSRPTAGSVFLSPKAKNDTKQAGPMIVDNAGRPIWFQPLPGVRAATDFRAQTFKGKPVLTYWQGTSSFGIGTGEMVMLDQSYRPIRRIRAPNGFRPDLHEFLITPRDTAVLITYPLLRADLRKFGGRRNGVLVDSVVQEIDLDTGLVIFEWHSVGNIALAEAIARLANPRAPWDYVHTNSVGLDTDGDFIMSARSTWGVYKIDRETGRITWRLGGKRSDFRLTPAMRFAWQHDARRRADGAITLFDNAAAPAVRKSSRALAFRLDERAKTATLLRAVQHPRSYLAATQGNQQTLPGGGMMVGFGSQRWFTEFDANGDVLWDARTATGYESYRAYRMPWVGRPRTRPRVAVVDGPGARIDVYASWNGATEVASWEVLAGEPETTLEPAGSAPRSGFETRIKAVTSSSHVAVRAKDASGRVLGTSPLARVRR